MLYCYHIICSYSSIPIHHSWLCTQDVIWTRPIHSHHSSNVLSRCGLYLFPCPVHTQNNHHISCVIEYHAQEATYMQQVQVYKVHCNQPRNLCFSCDKPIRSRESIKIIWGLIKSTGSPIYWLQLFELHVQCGSIFRCNYACICVTSDINDKISCSNKWTPIIHKKHISCQLINYHNLLTIPN